MATELQGTNDRNFYSESVHYLSKENISSFRKAISERGIYINSVLDKIIQMDKKFGPLMILELGAGTCLTSLILKSRIGRGEFTCMDISAERMAKLADDIATLVGSNTHGMKFVEGDFTFALPFQDNEFDIVMFDAALHHSRNIWTTLKESRRIVKSTGAVTAMREAYLSRFSYGFSINRLLKSPEFRTGVAENAYLKDQYRYYFLACGLNPEFLPVFSNWKWKSLSLLNGLILSKYNIWSTPLKQRGQR
ncbi:MAG: class I SAM-dependent methyltransferase [Methylococcales bacterium]